jgi:hypothetical protein
MFSRQFDTQVLSAIKFKIIRQGLFTITPSMLKDPRFHESVKIVGKAAVADLIHTGDLD